MQNAGTYATLDFASLGRNREAIMANFVRMLTEPAIKSRDGNDDAVGVVMSVSLVGDLMERLHNAYNGSHIDTVRNQPGLIAVACFPSPKGTLISPENPLPIRRLPIQGLPPGCAQVPGAFGYMFDDEETGLRTIVSAPYAFERTDSKRSLLSEPHLDIRTSGQSFAAGGVALQVVDNTFILAENDRQPDRPPVVAVLELP